MSRRAEKRGPVRADFQDVTRHISTTTKHALIAAAGGRCEFNGCNAYLFAHHVTKRADYFGNFAHIRAFSHGGPRADESDDRAQLNEIDNLMLLCQGCHTEVDRDVATFTVDRLRAWKRKHEQRVAFLLDLPSANEAAMLEIWTDVSRPPVVRSLGKMVAALLPLYPSRVHSYLVDFAGKNLTDATLIPAAIEQIDREVARLFASNGERPAHLAIFGITNIPLLVYLGAKVGDRIQAHLFQHHRDSSDWRWKDASPTAAFSRQCLRTGTSPSRVALLVSLSGSIRLEDLPASIDATYTVHELRLSSETPHTGFLRTRADLARAREEYRRCLAELRAAHGALTELAVFPAVPVPVAVALGMDRLPKVDPALAVYDFDKQHPTEPGWRYVLTVP